MSVTKHEMIRSATHIFRSKGFLGASIQDIADDCQIAKGSVYKHFSSKEELFCEVFEQRLLVYFEEAERLYQSSGQTPKEKLLQQIVYRFQYFVEFQFILVGFTELPLQRDAKFHAVRVRVRDRLIQWHKKCLSELYGERIEPHIWDLVFIFRALLKEYLVWIVQGVKPLTMEGTARFIVDKLDVLALHMTSSGAPPLLRQSSYEQRWGQGEEPAANELLLDELLAQLKSAAASLPAGAARREEMLQTAALLEAELRKPEPNGALIRALLAYLAAEEELKSAAVYLQSVIGSKLAIV